MNIAPIRVASQAIAAPTETDVLNSLARLTGPEEAHEHWRIACQLAHVARGELTADELGRGLQQLRLMGGLPSVAATAMLVLLGSSDALAAARASTLQAQIPADSYTPPRPLDPLYDPNRLREIAELDLCSEHIDAIVNELAVQASRLLRLPVAMLNVVLDQAQYTASHHGQTGWMAKAPGTPAQWAFCRFVVRNRSEYIVEDAALDVRVSDNPLVLKDGIRCYAGIPLVTANGYFIGAFCVAGHAPRTFRTVDLLILRSLASEAMRRLELRRPTAAEPLRSHALIHKSVVFLA